MRLCGAGSIPAGSACRFEIDGGDPIAVFNLAGTLHAIDDTCSHGHASLSLGDVDGEAVICPLHLGKFDIPSGRAIAFPASEDVRCYRVSETAAGIFVEIEP